MKPAIISIILVSSILAAMFLNFEPQRQNIKTKIYKNTLCEQVADNLSQMRQITKNAHLKELSQFNKDSKSIVENLKNNPKLSLDFIKDYTRLNTIVKNTARAIREHRPRLNHDLKKMKSYKDSFNKKLNSIGLKELNICYIKMQKHYKRYLRNQIDKDYLNYQEQNSLAKEIITELYLDDDKEQDIFSFLETQNKVIQGFKVVYDDVGIENIREVKPLIYTLKEHIQFQKPIYKLSASL